MACDEADGPLRPPPRDSTGAAFWCTARAPPAVPMGIWVDAQARSWPTCLSISLSALTSSSPDSYSFSALLDTRRRAWKGVGKNDNSLGTLLRYRTQYGPKGGVRD